MNREQKVVHSGSLKLFEKEKSRRMSMWAKYWAILGTNSLRLFTNHESFLNATEEPKLILITAESFCQSVNKRDQTFQFKITNDETFVFKCETESAREIWLDNLGKVLASFCRNTCFHCSKDDAHPGINSDNGDASRNSFTENVYNQPGEIVPQSTINSTSTNNPKHSTGREDQITVNSPLKIYDAEQNFFKSFNKTDRAKSESKMGKVITNSRAQEPSQSAPQINRQLNNQKSPKNSFGYTFDTESADHDSTSSLQLFDASNKRFSTFSKRSLKRQRAVTDFANPSFILDDSNLQQDLPEIPKIISKDFGTPINYDVPSLSKDDPTRGSLKVLIGNNKWKEYQATVEKNILILSDPENRFPGQNATRIELKPNLKFTILPRRSNDYRFKMTNGPTEYFFKTPNVNRRQSWIKRLTEATSTVCQMTCPQCCGKANRNITDHDDSQSDTSEISVDQSEEDNDDVFYVGMTNPSEGTTFANNALTQESVNQLCSTSDQQPFDSSQLESAEAPCFRSGYLKTNAIDQNWGQFWATITGRQLILHACEDNLNALKIIELTQNVECKTAKRSSYDFRFTLLASPVEFYEFKCVSAHDRRGWMTALEKVAGGLGGSESGSKISEIVTKIRENEIRLQEIQRQQQEDFMKQQEKQDLSSVGQDIYDDILQEQPQQQQQPQQELHGGQDVYDDILQQSQQNLDEMEDTYEVLPAEGTPRKHILPPTLLLPPLKPPKKQQEQKVSIEVGQDIYDDTTQQSFPGPPQQPPPATPPQKQHNFLQQLPPPPQQLPPLTPPQIRRKQEEQQWMNEAENGDDIVANILTQQPLSTPLQLSEQRQQINIADVGGELYELIPGENNQQEGAENEELYEVLPGEAIEQQSHEEQQRIAEKQRDKSTDKKSKKIFAVLHKKQKEKKKEQQDKQESEKKQNKREKENQTKPKQQQQHRQEEQTLQESLEQNVDPSDIEEDLSETKKATWNFEKHVQVLQETLQMKKESDLEIKEEEECAGVGDEENTQENSAEDETVVADITQDVERFLTQVLGKVNNLPGDVNKERLQLTEKLQKFLKTHEKDTTKRKPALPLPSKPTPADDQVDEGEYGDVATHDDGQETYDDVVKGDEGVEEMYDDVAHATEQQQEGEEEYDDVAALSKTETTDEPEEFYDDIDPGINTGIANRTLSKKSNSSEILDATGVGEPRRASDITDKIYDGDLEKYKSKGIFKKFQRRYCVLTPLALYYYENKKDQKQKGQIILPSSESTLRKGCHSFPEVKDKKLCFELLNENRCFLFKVTKESELDIWIKHIRAALSTDLSDEQSRIMRQKSIRLSNHEDDDVEDGEDLYECIDTMQQNKSSVEEEMYELTDQFSPETSGSSSVAPVLPSRVPAGKPPAGKPPAPQNQEEEEEEEFEKVDDDMEDFETDPSAPTSGGKGKDDEKPPAVVSRTKPSSSPTLPPRPSSSQDAPHLPPRTTPADKTAPPTLPTRTTPTLTKKSQPSPPESEPEPEPERKTEPVPKLEVLPPVKTKPLKGEQFDYNKVYVAMWNCAADNEDDLAFSRGNYLYIREKIPNSDWWVASLMDIPDIRVGLVPRNYIMPAYDM